LEFGGAFSASLRRRLLFRGQPNMLGYHILRNLCSNAAVMKNDISIAANLRFPVETREFLPAGTPAGAPEECATPAGMSGGGREGFAGGCGMSGGARALFQRAGRMSGSVGEECATPAGMPGSAGEGFARTAGMSGGAQEGFATTSRGPTWRKEKFPTATGNPTWILDLRLPVAAVCDRRNGLIGSGRRSQSAATAKG